MSLVMRVDVLQGGEGDDTRGYLHHPLESPLLCLSAAREPNWDAVREDALDGGAVEGHQRLLADGVLPNQTLPGFLDSWGVGSPSQVSLDGS